VKAGPYIGGPPRPSPVNAEAIKAEEPQPTQPDSPATRRPTHTIQVDQPPEQSTVRGHASH
jgi:hypothetical protein